MTAKLDIPELNFANSNRYAQSSPFQRGTQDIQISDWPIHHCYFTCSGISWVKPSRVPRLVLTAHSSSTSRFAHSTFIYSSRLERRISNLCCRGILVRVWGRVNRHPYRVSFWGLCLRPYIRSYALGCAHHYWCELVFAKLHDRGCFSKSSK